MSRIERLHSQGIQSYPARTGRTHTVRQAREPGAAGNATVIAGRLIRLDPRVGSGALEDWTGTVDLVLDDPALSGMLSRIRAGDLVECAGTCGDDAYTVTGLRLLAPCLRGAPEKEAAGGAPESEAASSAPDREVAGAVRLRADILAGTRAYFESRGFIAVDTPTFMAVPDLTPALSSFRTEYVDGEGGTRPLYLQTSPEHYMKRLLAAGCERIYQICRFYRNGERFDTHHPEFTGLEWYEAYADYETVMATTEDYVTSLAGTLNHGGELTYQGTAIDLRTPWPRYRMRDCFLDRSGIDLDVCDDLEAFSSAARARDYEVREDDDWDDLFHRVFLTAVEPALPADRPVFLTEYPARLPSLARRVPGKPRYVERFELYMGGLELANAFTELNDPVEQRARFEADLEVKRSKEGPDRYDGGVDEALLAALEYGMPPSGGIAFGLDRLAMLFADADTIDPVIMFRDF
ncbi:MAG: EF-P lysine aminoacylase GenX [Gemmatimonadetes bacterium]|nr:EF-P lysine aminoacylase GenX [Gemmatimonadota bacterium]MYG85636.1 EF-P lysine aminoacylase GenX [Gemmatimonadota bacterium]MYJ91405.1 EF-P lysine aminoacylase GenX [Gemmatimonadota bacterium]